MTKDQLQKIEEAAREYSNLQFHNLRGFAPSEFTREDKQYGYELALSEKGFSVGAHWALQNLITNHESRSATRREPIGEDLED